MGVHVFHRDDPEVVGMGLIARDARPVLWPAAGSTTATMNSVTMQPGKRNTLRVHPFSEDTRYVLYGFGSIEEFDAGVRPEFEAGQAVHVPVGVRHTVAANRGSHVESVGGFCPADWSRLERPGHQPDEHDRTPDGGPRRG